jgi:hypothetical protein
VVHELLDEAEVTQIMPAEQRVTTPTERIDQGSFGG